MAPATLLIITPMLFMAFNRAAEVAIILAALPVALAGGVWLIWWLEFDLSVAVLVGFIALAGVAVETAIVMLLYLNLAWDHGHHRRLLEAELPVGRRHQGRDAPGDQEREDDARGEEARHHQGRDDGGPRG